VEGGVEEPGGDGYKGHVVRKGPEEVELGVGHHAPGELEELHNLREVSPSHHHVACLLGHLGAAADRDAYICCGEGRSVVDAVAHEDHAPLLPKLLHDLGLLLRLGAAEVSGDAQLGGHGGDGAFAVAGHHHGLKPHRPQPLDCRRRVRPQLVSHGRKPPDLAVYRHVYHGQPLGPQLLGEVSHVPRRLCAEGLHQLLVADAYGPAADRGVDAHAREGVVGIRRAQRQAQLGGVVHKRPGEGVRGLGLGGGGVAQSLRVAYVLHHAWGPPGQRPGLVEGGEPRLQGLLEGLGILHEESLLCGAADAHDDRQRGREAEGAGTRNHEDRRREE
jgi:hypothetical protein